jgi:hypothetical protein
VKALTFAEELKWSISAIFAVFAFSSSSSSVGSDAVSLPRMTPMPIPSALLMVSFIEKMLMKILTHTESPYHLFASLQGKADILLSPMVLSLSVLMLLTIVTTLHL